MGCFRVLLCILLPPLAVADRGCGSIVLVAFLTLLGWIPGILAALIICNAGNKSHLEEIPLENSDGRVQERPSWAFHKATRKQIDYLIDLGAIKNPDVNLNMLEASRLIDKTIWWKKSKTALIQFAIILAAVGSIILYVIIKL